MAKLREQKNLVRAVYECPSNLMPTDNNIRAYFMTRPLFLSDEKNKLPGNVHRSLITGDLELVSDDQRDRNHRIEILIRSCIEDKFIIPTIQEREREDFDEMQKRIHNILDSYPVKIPKIKYTIDGGYKATSRGTDLLTQLGFWTIVLEKYNPIMIFLGSSLVSATIYWIILHLWNLVAKEVSNLFLV